MIGEDHLHIIEKEAAQELILVVNRSLMFQLQKNIIEDKARLKPFNYRCPETKIFLF